MSLHKSLIYFFLLFVQISVVFFCDIFPLFVLESSTGFMSRILQVISIYLTWILQPLQFSLLPFIESFWVLFIILWFMLFHLQIT